MKKLIFLSLLLLIGCGPYYETYFTKHYTNDIQTVTIGNPIMGVESGTRHIKAHQYKAGTYQELVYMGIENNTISIDYREYSVQGSKLYIKDGFTQHLKYDISKEKVIKYKNVKIEVIEAGNDLKCKILEG